ncbi:flagellin [Rhodobacteraceae bacterium]|nr:flagellin [Paracoccaceae bacterium]
MALTVATNTGALMAQAAASSVNKEMETSMERLSTGLRINSAADDAAGVAIVSRMDSQIKGTNQAIRNAVDGQNMIDTAEAAHQEVEAIIQRIRELAIQSANDTNVSLDRVALNAEVIQLTAELDRISGQTTFNGVELLDGNFTNKQLQIGADARQVVSFDIDSTASASIGSFQLTSISHTAAANTIDGEDLVVTGYLGAATAAIGAGDSAKDAAAAINADTGSTGVTATAVTKMKLKSLSAAEAVAFTLTGDAAASISVTVTATSDLGVLKDAINAASGTTGITATFGDDSSEVVLTHAGGEDIAITSLDTATNSTTLTAVALDRLGTATTDTLAMDESSAAAAAVVGQVEMNSIKAFTVTGDDATAEDGFFNTTSANTTANAKGTATTGGGTATLSSIASVDISTVAGANAAIAAADGALNKVSTARADLGALSNRLNYTVANLTSVSNAISASRSSIADADFANETTTLAKTQILQQASTAMLAQANASKQNVLSLLQG